MRFHPDRITVPGRRPAGHRADQPRQPPPRPRPGHRGEDRRCWRGTATARLDAGVIGGTVAGLVLPARPPAGRHDPAPSPPTGGTAGRRTTTAPCRGTTALGTGRRTSTRWPTPARRSPPATPPPPPRAADRVHRIELHVQEVDREVAPGVTAAAVDVQRHRTRPGAARQGRRRLRDHPGQRRHHRPRHRLPRRRARPGHRDAHRSIPAQQLTYRFTATRAGIWMYHCSTMPMLLPHRQRHVRRGHHRPARPRRRSTASTSSCSPSSTSARDGQPGDLAKMQADQPDAVVFNGYAAQYAHRPLTARRANGYGSGSSTPAPTGAAAFHIVGAQFDTVYREGDYLLRPGRPRRRPDPRPRPGQRRLRRDRLARAGHYPFVTHAMVDAERGARGVLDVQGRAS